MAEPSSVPGAAALSSALSPSALSSTAPSSIAGRYRVGEQIGSSGRSVVYEAEDPLLDRTVAVKVFRSGRATAVDLRAQVAEARLAAGLNHYAVTTLFDAGVDESEPADPRLYIVMERIEGVDLRQHLDREGPLRPAQLAYLGFDLAEGLQHVHEHGFLHRDLKPANVLIADRASECRIRGKLTDFGIASIIGERDDSEYASGTAAYMSPEQVDGQNATTASDVYALGLVLLEALTGEIAFPGTIRDSAYARLDHDPVIPDSVPPSLARILRGMTSLLPERRPLLPDVALGFQAATVQDLVAAGRVDPRLLAAEEEARLAAVRRYDILDTPPEDAFDRISHLACRLLNVPVAFVAIVDADREWFKSSRGLDLTEIDRNHALCAVTVTSGRPFLLADVRGDARFAKNPILRADESLRAFAAVPLTTNDGHPIGTLCVFDRRVREFTEQEIDDLQQLAAIVIRELDLRLASRRAIFA